MISLREIISRLIAENVIIKSLKFLLKLSVKNFIETEMLSDINCITSTLQQLILK